MAVAHLVELITPNLLAPSASSMYLIMFHASLVLKQIHIFIAVNVLPITIRSILMAVFVSIVIKQKHQLHALFAKTMGL